MTANLLTSNSSKTEFLLIGLQQHSKIHNCSLNTTDSARNLGFIFDSHLTFSDQISSLSLSLVIITFVNFVVSAPILTSKLQVPLSHLLFTITLITATLCTTTFRNLKQIVFRLSRTLLSGFLISFQSPRATRSSSFAILSRPLTSSSLRITNRSFRYASPHLWNQLPVSFRQPCTKHTADDVTLSNSPPTCSALSPSITHSLFHSRLKTHLFHKSFPP